MSFRKIFGLILGCDNLDLGAFGRAQKCGLILFYRRGCELFSAAFTGHLLGRFLKCKAPLYRPAPAFPSPTLSSPLHLAQLCPAFCQTSPQCSSQTRLCFAFSEIRECKLSSNKGPLIPNTLGVGKPSQNTRVPIVTLHHKAKQGCWRLSLLLVR